MLTSILSLQTVPGLQARSSAVVKAQHDFVLSKATDCCSHTVQQLNSMLLFLRLEQAVGGAAIQTVKSGQCS